MAVERHGSGTAWQWNGMAVERHGRGMLFVNRPLRDQRAGESLEDTCIKNK